MHFGESLNISVTAILTNKLRSALTLLGIIIGVMTIIAMQSLITGMRNSVKNQANILSSDVFQIQKYPSVGGGDWRKYRNRKDITIEEAEVLRERMTAALNIGAEVWTFGQEIRHKDKKTLPMMPVVGATPEFLEHNSYNIAEGRFLTNQDVDLSRRIAVIGQDVKERLFPYEYPVGKDIKIQGERFEVIGVFDKTGSMFGETRDNRVAVPITRFQKVFGKERSLNITVKATGPEEYQTAIDQAIGILRSVRKVPPGEDNDFEIRTNEQFMEFFDNLTKSVKLVAIAIASISLIVAGVGIMNIMLVSVTERTKEIGIRKSLGAKKRDVLLQFLIEAVILTEFGGVIGVFVGLGIGFLVRALTSIPAAVPLWTVVVGLVFCSVVGIVFGVYPATKAAKMDPITALRYE